MESFAKKEGVYAEWSPNEKVALEVAIGASAAGARVLTTMKHVGVNVAADPLFTAAYTGVGGGLLIMAADDPGMHSSQNEQDSRFYALAANIPMLEPADSQEALEFARDSFELSERFDVPFFIRSTVRISHTKTPVQTGERLHKELVDYTSNAAKWVMMPAFAKPRRTVLDLRVAELEAWVENCRYNRTLPGDSSIGVICAGATYQHVVEALPHASVFKLGVTWPLPKNALREFASSVDKVYVIEEASTYLSSQVASLGIELSKPLAPLSKAGELTPGAIKVAFGLSVPESRPNNDDVPGRPPALCAGCPHRLVFKELKRIKAIVTGDIGCYTLGALAPLSAIDTCIDMGASVSMAHGFELAYRDLDKHRPIVGVIGDSTFGHSGLSSLIGTVYNQGSGTILILDNRTTAMTGRQGNPFNGETLQGRPSTELDLETVVKSLGVKDVRTLDPMNAKVVRTALKETTSSDALSVIIFRSPCALIDRKRDTPVFVNDNCQSCGVCTTLGCPAISRNPETDHALIDELQCIGCGQCEQYCAFSAMERKSLTSEGEAHV
jgi:indolepyruvate ferredoxin oxidoreductase alpha subunit